MLRIRKIRPGCAYRIGERLVFLPGRDGTLHLKQCTAPRARLIFYRANQVVRVMTVHTCLEAQLNNAPFHLAGSRMAHAHGEQT